jgi:hypothetical protein
LFSNEKLSWHGFRTLQRVLDLVVRPLYRIDATLKRLHLGNEHARLSRRQLAAVVDKLLLAALSSDNDGREPRSQLALNRYGTSIELGLDLTGEWGEGG